MATYAYRNPRGIPTWLVWNQREMAVSKNRGTPKWMVKIMENPMKIHDLGVPLFLETPKWREMG